MLGGLDPVTIPMLLVPTSLHSWPSNKSFCSSKLLNHLINNVTYNGLFFFTYVTSSMLNFSIILVTDETTIYLNSRIYKKIIISYISTLHNHE